MQNSAITRQMAEHHQKYWNRPDGRVLIFMQVIAIDIYPFQPETVPENLYLQVDDLNNRFVLKRQKVEQV